MTLDGLGDALYGGLQISPWAIVYYASYVLLSSFLMVNLLIGVVLDSLAQAREMDVQRRAPAGAAAQGEAANPVGQELRDRIAAARAGLEALEQLLPQVPAQPDKSGVPENP
ncbi:ion transporter [Streptomyces sp. NPDC006283]|uniref:ion transporter n=1 Tax=Streptomyces sp. NPDC006283 TaxID=3156741 RepID=UPI0033AF8244